jgi:hypothetical protein
LLPTLWNGFVLAAVPAFVARAAAVLCLGSGAGLLLFGFRLGEQAEESDAGGTQSAAAIEAEEDAWELGV